MWYSVALWLMYFPFAKSRGKICAHPDLPRFSKAITPKQESYEQNSTFYYQCDNGYHFERNTVRHKIFCENTYWQPINLWKCYDACNNACGNHGTCVKTLGGKPTEETSTICQCDKNYAGKRCDARVCESEPTGLHHLHPHLEIGSRSVNGKYPLGALINYRCEDNYFIKNGQTRAHCETEGWVPSQVPVCEANACFREKFVAGMFTPMHRDYKPGETITFRCYEGFVLIGERKAVCRNGIWTPKWPFCMSKCEKKLFPNGDYTPVQAYYRRSEYIHFKCNADYNLVGSDELICLEGDWSAPWPSCERMVFCGPPPVVKNAIVLGLKNNRYPINDIVSYECKKRYIMNGERKSIRCLFQVDNNGEEPRWEEPPSCDITCGQGNKMRRRGDGKYYCETKHIITTTVTSSVKPLTIVTATAGALLLLLLIVISLVAYQRRRIALTSRRQRRERLTNEDDRYSFVYYSNDVHVVLPSYDEAMRVQGAPPPYNVDATAAPTTASADTGGARVESYSQDTSRRGPEIAVASPPSFNEVIYDAIDDSLLPTPCCNPQQQCQQNELIQAPTATAASGSQTSDNSHKETDNENVINYTRDNNNQINYGGINLHRGTHQNNGDNSYIGCTEEINGHNSYEDNRNTGDNPIVNTNNETDLGISSCENPNHDDDRDTISIGSGSSYSDTTQLIGE